MKMKGRRLKWMKIGWNGVGDDHATWWWKLQDEWMVAATCSPPKAHKMRLGKEIKSHKALSQFSRVSFHQLLILKLQEPSLSIYSRRWLKWKATQSQISLLILIQIWSQNKSHGRCDLFLLWHLLKITPAPTILSHGRCDLSLYIGTPYFNIYTLL